MRADRKRIYEEKAAIATRLERERLGIGKYVKRAPRDPDKREILLNLAAERVRRAEEGDYLRVGFRRRKLRL